MVFDAGRDSLHGVRAIERRCLKALFAPGRFLAGRHSEALDAGLMQCGRRIDGPVPKQRGQQNREECELHQTSMPVTLILSKS